MPRMPQKAGRRHTPNIPPKFTASKKTIVWLASYPKSGNTWTRLVLANYLMNREEPLSINDITKFCTGDASANAYERVGGPGFDKLHPTQHLQYRDLVLGQISANGADVNFVKSHNMNMPIFNVPLFSPNMTRAATYIVRHPFDVTVSYARHFGMTSSEAARSICNLNNTTKAVGKNVKQFLSSWSNHVESWVTTKSFPVHVMRYEDMKKDPVRAFGGLIEALDVSLDQDRLARALKFSAFEELQKQEMRDGFVEASQNTERFFHTGGSGQWQDVLTKEDQDLIRQANGPMMAKFGYE